MSEFDKDLKPGDLITAYRAGYHRVIRIERQFVSKNELRFDFHKNSKLGDEYYSLVHYQTVLSSNGKKSRSKLIHLCGIDYCDLVTQETLFIARAAAIKLARGIHDSVTSELNSS